MHTACFGAGCIYEFSYDFSRGISSVYRLKDVFEVEPSIKNKDNPVKILRVHFVFNLRMFFFLIPDERRLVLKILILKSIRERWLV